MIEFTRVLEGLVEQEVKRCLDELSTKVSAQDYDGAHALVDRIQRIRQAQSTLAELAGSRGFAPPPMTFRSEEREPPHIALLTRPTPSPPPPVREPVSSYDVIQRANLERERRIAHGEARKRFFDWSREVLATSAENPESSAQLKACVCECRALMAEADRLGDSKELLLEEFNLLREKYGSEVVGFFPALQLTSFADPGRWRQLRDTYHLLAEAEQLLPAVESLPRGATRDQAVVELAAVEAWMHRLWLVVSERHDSQQIQLHKRLDELKSPDIYVPFWRSEATGGFNDDEIATAAADAPRRVADLLVDGEKVQARNTALEDLKSFLASPPDDEFEPGLEARVQAVLGAGIPASDIRLRDMLRPYAGLLPTHATGPLKTLVRYLESQPETIDDEKDDDDQPDAEFEQKLNELRQFTAGKSILLVGWSKGQEHRRDELKETLQLNELYWPDSEPGSHLDIFEGAVKKADIVLQVIRWSRHGYGQVLQEASRQGKVVGRLPAGLGTRRVVHDLHHQFVGRIPSQL